MSVIRFRRWGFDKIIVVRVLFISMTSQIFLVSGKVGTFSHIFWHLRIECDSNDRNKNPWCGLVRCIPVRAQGKWVFSILSRKLREESISPTVTINAIGSSYEGTCRMP